MADYIMVCGEEDGDCTEVEVDGDSTVSVASIACQFTGTHYCQPIISFLFRLLLFCLVS